MKFNLKRDFCLWVVPASDGRVRKLRFSLKRAVLVLTVFLLVAGGFVYVASDYGRVQILRAKNYFSLMRVTKERDSLLSERNHLDGKVSELQVANGKALDYERNVRQRLEELRSVLHGASSLGVIPADELTKPLEPEAGTVAQGGGVGGAEIDCKDGRCFDYQESNAASSLFQDGSLSADLLDQLDNYLFLLSTVPLGSPGNGYITSGYGYRLSPFTRRTQMHQGIDISLPIGSYVHSTAEGYVTSVKRTGTYGLMVDVRHSNNVVTRYAHLSKAYVSEGEKLCRGEVVGLAGSTGRSTGPHLHYEIRVSGKAINPLRFMELARDLVQIF